MAAALEFFKDLKPKLLLFSNTLFCILGGKIFGLVVEDLLKMFGIQFNAWHPKQPHKTNDIFQYVFHIRNSMKDGLKFRVSIFSQHSTHILIGSRTTFEIIAWRKQSLGR